MLVLSSTRTALNNEFLHTLLLLLQNTYNSLQCFLTLVMLFGSKLSFKDVYGLLTFTPAW